MSSSRTAQSIGSENLVGAIQGQHSTARTNSKISGTPGQRPSVSGQRPSAHGGGDAPSGFTFPGGGGVQVTRRQFLAGAIGIGAVAATAGVVVVVSDSGSSDDVDTLEVAEDAVLTLSDCESLEDAPLTLENEFSLPYGSLVWASCDEYAACLIPTDGATPLTQVAILPLDGSDDSDSDSAYTVVLEGPVSEESGYDIYDVRCNENGLIWLEANCFTDEWRVYATTHSNGVIGEPVLLDSGDDDWDEPFIAVAGSRAFWQVLPDASGSKSTEYSLLKSVKFGSSDIREDWSSYGRMCTPPYSTRDGIVITPRVDSSSVYHQLTLLDASTGEMLDSLILPISMKPVEAGYLNGRFTFTFDSIYSYGDGIANLGTYAPMEAGGGSGDEWFRFDRDPTAAPAWAAGCLIVKSSWAVSCVDLDAQGYYSLDVPDDCDDYGDYLASTGEAERIVTYTSLPGADDPSTTVRTWVANTASEESETSE